MALSPFPARPTRAATDLRQTITPWTSQAMAPVDPSSRDWPMPNPWIRPELVGPTGYSDERHWVQMELNPAIHGAMSSRIAQLLGGGVKLEQGEGDGSEELLDFWNFVMSEQPLVTLTAIALRSMFRGHEIFEIVRAWREWNGKRVFVPALIKDALTWQFRWTVGRDLVYQPGGLVQRIYRPGTAPPHLRLPHLMKFWTPAIGRTISNPYGEPMHYFASIMEFAARELSQAGFVQISQAQGFLTVSHDLDMNDPKAIATVNKIVTDIKTMFRASGVLVKPGGYTVEWEALTEAIGSHTGLWDWFDNSFRSFYAGGSLQMASAGGGGRARSLGEVHERQGQRLSSMDAAMLAEDFRSGLLHPWSAWNAETIAPQAFRATAATPRLADVPLDAVPRLSFPSLNRIRSEDLEVLRALGELGVTDNEDDETMVRPDVAAILKLIRIPLLEEGQDGPTLDLAKQVPPPSPFDDQGDLPLGDRRGDPNRVEIEEEGARG